MSKNLLKNLKKNGQVEAYHAAFQKNIDDGSFTEISNEELKEWDDQGLPSNYVSLHPVKKLQSDPSKLAIRIVTNSSLNRLARVGGKTVTTPLHAGRQCWGKSILPRAGYGLGTYRTVDIFNFSHFSLAILEKLRFLCFYIIKSMARKGYFGPKSDFRGSKIPPRGASST